MNKKLIVITGPTASGKTALSVDLAKRLNCAIISADSRQFYKKLSIGTAKPTIEEQQGVPHYFIDSHSVETPLTSGQFEKLALATLGKLFSDSDYAILVGGSGMFIDALIYGIDDLPHDKKIRDYFNNEFEEKGLEFLQEQLKAKDPEVAKKIDLQNPLRVIRALEIREILGKSQLDISKNTKIEREFETHYFVIDHPREALYERINLRVEDMFEKGLLEEVKSVEKWRNLQSLNTVGYKELFDYLDGKISLEEAKELIKRNSRRYAKRQLTWFRRNKDAIWLNYDSINKMSEKILFHLEEIN